MWGVNPWLRLQPPVDWKDPDPYPGGYAGCDHHPKGGPFACLHESHYRNVHEEPYKPILCGYLHEELEAMFGPDWRDHVELVDDDMREEGICPVCEKRCWPKCGHKP